MGNNIVAENLPVMEIKFSYKMKAVDRPKILRSSDIYDLLKEGWSERIEYIEEFVLLVLDRSNRVTGKVVISMGGVTGTVVDPKVIFQYALLSNACAIVIAHNHPSGNLNPSQADINLTKKINEAARFHEIVLLDHLIMTNDNGYYSFADEGVLN